MTQFKIASVAIALLLSVPAVAADRDKAAAIKGAGAQSCENFVASRKEKKELYGIYVSWLQGMLSGYNLMAADTYDIAAWQTPELMAYFLDQFCQKNPTIPFGQASSELIKALVPMRVEERSDIVTFTSSSDSKVQIPIYKEILRRVQRELAKRGHYDSVADGIPGPRTEQALKDFQKERGIAVTGIPDQVTLVLLFEQKK